MARKNFRAVIVGGSLAGLTLANILERLGIDFVLLESHAEWAPQVGASIALAPNGLRIMDQLGCLEAFTDGTPALENHFLATGGVPLLTHHRWSTLVTNRYGAGVYFADRQKLLQVLYDNLKNKDKLLLNKRVVKVATTETGVTVETKDGSRYSGDIVVGVDGIYSAVRREMWRIAAEASPGYFPGTDPLKQLPIEYKCLFGIARPHKRLGPGVALLAMARKHSWLIATGPGNRVYFFLFVKLPEKIWGDKSPRYTKEDALAVADQYRDEVLIDDCTFGQIVAEYTSIGMTPLHEHVFEKWHYDRMITFGDAAHKPNPLSGHGGNAAMESAATFSNELVRALDRLPDDGSSTLSPAEIDSVFRATQASRIERAHKIVKVTRKNQKFEAPESFLAHQMSKLVPRTLSHDKLQEALADVVVGAARVERLPMPFHPHYTPFVDELPARPIKYAILPRAMMGLALVGLVSLAGHVIKFDKPLPDSFFGHGFRSVYTGNGSADGLLDTLTRVFSLALASPVAEQRIQLAYFLWMLTPCVLIWVVEANRRGNLQTIRGRLLAWPGIYALMYQLLTIARVSPVYFLVTLLISLNPLYSRPSSRIVDVDVARSVLPAVALGYCVPTILMCMPLRSHPGAWLDFTSFWQVSPALAGPLTAVFASLLRSNRAGGGGGASKGQAELDAYKNKDLPHLLAAYTTAFWATAVVHACTLAYFAFSPRGRLSLSRAFFDVPVPWGPLGSAWDAPLDAREATFVLFKWDHLIYVATLLVWCLWTVFEMRRLGYVTTARALRVAPAVAGSLILLGPGAMYAGTWYWREKTIAGVSRMEESEDKKQR